MFYVASYAAMNVGAFAIVSHLAGNGERHVTLEDYAGLGRRSPVLAALLTSHITAAMDDVPARGSGREALVDRVVAVAARLRGDELVMAVLRSELALVYIAQRLGSSQQMLIDALADDLRAAQRGGSVRAGDPRRLAAMVLLITQSTIQSAEIVRPILDADALAAELAYSLNGYLS